MKKILVALAVTAAISTAPASASVKGMKLCSNVVPSGPVYLYASPAVSCTTARTIERYWEFHQVPAVWIAGLKWAHYYGYGQDSFAVTGHTWRAVTILEART
jgi:hypothetical protein